MSLSEVFNRLHYEPSHGGQPWHEALPPVPGNPFEAAERTVRAVKEVGAALQSLNSVGYICPSFHPDMFMKTDQGIRIRDLPERITRAGRPAVNPKILPGYAAPEIVEQPGAHLSLAMDVFHLGALFYYLAIRKFPEVTTREGLHACRYWLPRFRIYDPTFPLGFEHVWLRAVQVNPAHRYPNVEAFLKALDQALEEVAYRSKMHEPVRYDVGARTIIGSVKGKLYPVNQDTIFPNPDMGEKSFLPETRCDVLGIADGVTHCKHGVGETASRIVIDSLKLSVAPFVGPSGASPAEWTLDQLYEAMQDAVLQATIQISHSFPAEEQIRPEHVMSSTLVAAAVRFQEIIVGSTGNSRAYLMSPEYVEQVNLDDDIGHGRIRSGMPPEEMLRQSGNSMLRRVVGACMLENGRLAPDTRRLRFSGYRVFLKPGDALLLCSDGMIEPGRFLAPHEAWKTVREDFGLPAQEICDRLIAAADARQKPPAMGDNISCIIIKAMEE